MEMSDAFFLIYLSQSFPRAPRPLVGPDLAQTLAPGVSCALSIMLLNRSCFFQLLLAPGVHFLLTF